MLDQIFGIFFSDWVLNQNTFMQQFSLYSLEQFQTFRTSSIPYSNFKNPHLCILTEYWCQKVFVSQYNLSLKMKSAHGAISRECGGCGNTVTFSDFKNWTWLSLIEETHIHLSWHRASILILYLEHFLCITSWRYRILTSLPFGTEMLYLICYNELFCTIIGNFRTSIVFNKTYIILNIYHWFEIVNPCNDSSNTIC